VAEGDLVTPPVVGSVANVRLVPACGHVAGAIANTDLSLGVMRAPANIPILGIVDVRSAVNDAQHGELNDAGVDVLRAEFGRVPALLGARTVSDDPDWRYVNVVRMVLALKRAFEVALRWAVFEPNDAPTRAAVAATLIAILTLFWQRGAFAGATMAESFYVRCDDATTDADARDNGRLIALVGIAPAAPAEFIVLRVGRQDNLPIVTLLQKEALA
jgi:phage tail sheath protein FI